MSAMEPPDNGGAAANGAAANGAGAGGEAPGVRRFPAHDPKLLEASIARAKHFYKYDRQLSVADRQQLSSFFWQKTAFYPLLGLPVVYGFIVLPRLLQRRGILNPKRSYKLMQCALGFVGLGVGFQCGATVSSWVHMGRLRDNEPALRAYDVLRRYPPQLGSRYFQMTAARPDLALKNPASIDWKKSPLFPIVLVMNDDVVREVKRADSERVHRFEESRREQTRRQIEQRQQAGAVAAGAGPGEPTGTSWDRVIEQNSSAGSRSAGHSPDGSSDGLSDSFGDDLSDGRGDDSGQAAPAPAQPPANPVYGASSSYASSGLGPAKYSSTPSYDAAAYSASSSLNPPLSSSWDSGSSGGGDTVSEEQRRFDEMLERERREALQDDFGADGKKWT